MVQAVTHGLKEERNRIRRVSTKPSLTADAHSCIDMHMRTTLNVDDQLLRPAGQLAGVQKKTQLVRLGLEALISRHAKPLSGSLDWEALNSS